MLSFWCRTVLCLCLCAPSYLTSEGQTFKTFCLPAKMGASSKHTRWVCRLWLSHVCCCHRWIPQSCYHSKRRSNCLFQSERMAFHCCAGGCRPQLQVRIVSFVVSHCKVTSTLQKCGHVCFFYQFHRYLWVFPGRTHNARVLVNS